MEFDSQALLMTTIQQRRARRYEGAAAGRLQLKPPAADFDSRLQEAERRHAGVAAAALELAAARPDLERTLRQVVADAEPIAAAAV